MSRIAKLVHVGLGAVALALGAACSSSSPPTCAEETGFVTQRLEEGYCDGTSRTCGAVSVAGCSGQAGCSPDYVNSECTGYATPCSRITKQTACNSQFGCGWVKGNTTTPSTPSTGAPSPSGVPCGTSSSGGVDGGSSPAPGPPGG